MMMCLVRLEFQLSIAKLILEMLKLGGESWNALVWRR